MLFLCLSYTERAKEEFRGDYIGMAIKLAPRSIINIAFAMYILKKIGDENHSHSQTIDFCDKYEIFASDEIDYTEDFFIFINRKAFGSKYKIKKQRFISAQLDKIQDRFLMLMRNRNNCSNDFEIFLHEVRDYGILISSNPEKADLEKLAYFSNQAKVILEQK